MMSQPTATSDQSSSQSTTSTDSAISNAIPFLKTELTHLMEEMIRVLTKLGEVQDDRMTDIQWPPYIENRDALRDFNIK